MRRKSNPSKLNSVRNPDGIWINTNLFREEALNFQKYGYYTPEPWGSPAWKEYWSEQLRRCREGYSVGGVKITGNHYNYLNFTRIKLTESSQGNVAIKKESFPDFWDGDYNYFWCMEIARHGLKGGIKEFDALNLSVRIKEEHLIGGKHLIVGKARRKGYSYKNASVCANIYNHKPKSTTIIGAYDKKYLYPEGTMGMASEYLNFYNEHTGWRKSRDYVDKSDMRKASYKKYVEGIPIEAGYKSLIYALTFGDNPDAARGKDADLILFEEAGKFPNLKGSYTATEPTLRSGRFTTGLICIFGTGGDMERDSVEFSEMFYEPDVYDLLCFENIWDDDAEGSQCGFFHPFYWNNDGYYDKDGNSDVKKAVDDENIKREKLKKTSTGSKALQARVQEYPAKPAEAFLTVSFNDFPTVELQNRLNLVNREKIHEKLGQVGYLFRDDGGVKFRQDLSGELQPIWKKTPGINEDRKGSIIIFEHPIKGKKGLYKLGYDPYANEDGNSLTAIYVYKDYYSLDSTRETLVAQYIGRPGDPDDANRVFELLTEYYEAQGSAMYENMVFHVKSYFTRRKKLNYLAAQPDRVISKAIKDSGVERVYGCHMNDDLKRAGEDYIKSWLLKERDATEDGRILTTIDFINDPGLLEELIKYNRKGNFDRVMALMMIMFQCQEEELGKDYGGEKASKKFEDLLNLGSLMFKK